MSHWEKCRQAAIAHAEQLGAAIREGRLNASALDGLMRSYLDQPAFYPEWRADLLREALARA